MKARGRSLRIQLATALFVIGAIGLSGRGLAEVPDEASQVEQLPEFVPVRIAGPLEFPWSIAFLPEGGFLVTERAGRLQFIGKDGLMHPVKNLPPIVNGYHAGLHDVALDPGFAENGILYLSYTHGTEALSTTRVLKARLLADRTTLTDQQVIFESSPPAASLEMLGGRLAITADGYLFLSLGDRWEPMRAQDLSDHAGSIIRIRTDGSIPDDNPLLTDPAARPEIWSFGHRNPQGLAIELGSGRVWAHEHGPQGGDELNLIEPGRNYGWPVITHGIGYDGQPIGIGTEGLGLEQPVRWWVPSIAPSGLAIQEEGEAVRFWIGALAGQKLVRLLWTGGHIREEQQLLVDQVGRIRDVRLGPDGLVYFVTDEPEGGLYRLIPAIEQVDYLEGERL